MKKVVSGILFFAAFFTSKGQITYVDVNPDSCICGSGYTAPYFREDSLDVDGNGIKDFRLESSWDGSNGGYGSTMVFALNSNLVAGDSVGAFHMVSGDSVSPQTGWVTGAVKIELVNYFGFSGHWQGWDDGFLGIRFLSGITWYYGWLRIYAAEGVGQASIILKDFAYSINPLLAGEGDPNAIQVNKVELSSCVYPNPVASDSKIKIDTPFSSAEVRIFNLEGKVVLREPIFADSFPVKRSALESGVYFYEIIADRNKIFRGRFVVD